MMTKLDAEDVEIGRFRVTTMFDVDDVMLTSYTTDGLRRSELLHIWHLFLGSYSSCGRGFCWKQRGVFISFLFLLYFKSNTNFKRITYKSQCCFLLQSVFPPGLGERLHLCVHQNVGSRRPLPPWFVLNWAIITHTIGSCTCREDHDILFSCNNISML